MNSPSSIKYLNSDQLYYLNKETDIEKVLSFFSKFRQFEKGFGFLPEHAFFVFDYTREKHILLNGPIEGVIGYHPRDFLDGGIDFFEEIFNRRDYKVFRGKCFAFINNLFALYPQETHSQYLFETNYRINDKYNLSHSILQRGSYITDEKTNRPLFFFGICMDISLYKKDTSIVQIISKYNSEGNAGKYSHIATNYFYPDYEESVLTKREREIVKWMADGWSSKQIAGKFKLSLNTIMNHRKNMLRKANAKNVAELIKYSIVNGII